jgi:multidrug efflux pump subunit AcrA (membrane-fusion protein)
MRILRSTSWYLIAVAIVCIGAAFFLLYKVLFPSVPVYVTATVERGTVSELVSVSGFVEARQVAKLAFPATGIVTGLLVQEGSDVEVGALLATLAASTLVAERTEAQSALTAAEAAYREVIAGPRSEAVTLANTTLNSAEAALARTNIEETRKINNARAALMSTDLTATAIDPEEKSTAPTVSGTYTCLEEGTYSLTLYRSSAKSGYSYTYTGLESGTGLVSTDQPAALGSCGLFLQFTADDWYQNSRWSIEIPNTRSSSYTTLLNTYNLTKTQASNAITAAENNLAVAKDQNTLTIAPARSEAVTQAAAVVAQARARIAAIDARLADRSIVAPFDGVVTEVNIAAGETASSIPVITLLASEGFTVRARIPEIDITKIQLGQRISAVFDARSRETVFGEVTFISPIAKQIDGVAYFEITIELEETPTWLRAGLNADIDIIIEQRENVLRVPKRFVITNQDGTRSVLLPRGHKIATTTIEVLFTGNDSFLEVSGIAEGTAVIAP